MIRVLSTQRAQRANCISHKNSGHYEIVLMQLRVGIFSRTLSAEKKRTETQSSQNINIKK